MVRKSGFDGDWFGSEEILLDRQKKQKKRVQVSSITSYMDYISMKKKKNNEYEIYLIKVTIKI